MEINESFVFGCFGIHTWTGFDFNQPHLPVFFNHQVIPDKLKAVFSIIVLILNILQRSFPALLDFWPYFLRRNVHPKFLFKMIGVLVRVTIVPNSFRVGKIGVIFLYRINGRFIFPRICLGVICLRMFMPLMIIISVKTIIIKSSTS
jgi:hypothetical protein